MNALYVTVSIPLLLVLAGFNHAHGLTTFGKTQNQPTTPVIPGKPCGNHTSCRAIQGTSCVPEPRDSSRKSCLCGDNQPPKNGACSAELKGPKHLCADSSQCVDGAQCISPDAKNSGNSQEIEKICKCMEGYIEINSSCNGGGRITSFSSWALMLLASSAIVLSKFL